MKNAIRKFRGRAILAVLVITAATLTFLYIRSGFNPSSKEERPPQQIASFVGSPSCRECHEKFYQLWSTSRHGLAMQPVTPEFLKAKLTAQAEPIRIKEVQYQARISDGRGFVLEKGRGGEKKYPLEHALGGKNVYYFLTSLSQGRLQVLPLAYDGRKKEWFDTTGSMIRHFVEGGSQPVDWQDPLLTFNTACYSCHVSQLSTNYDLKTDTYRTVWAEPGINCETCHGPAGEHNRVCREAPKDTVPADLKIISVKKFTVAQHNDTCAPCHAKMMPLTRAYPPGAPFFDHFDLTTLEDRDFSPDGRDLGENYTLTLWRLSPCVKSGKLSCLHCHTSSGRYRFKEEAKANQACLPCHDQRVEQRGTHIHHPADKTGTPQKCIACHMPMTEFARMRRTDHSMLPPAPAATLAFNSPNACNLCHKDKDAAWADRKVREWRKRDYQAPVLHRAGLVEAARRRDWTRLPEMLDYISNKDRDEVFATSLIRLLNPCNDDRKWPALRRALKDPSPLVRGAAAMGLQGNLTPETRDALLAATEDNYLLGRVRAAEALAAYPRELLSPPDQQRLAQATGELRAAFMARPDDWTSHYNLGNFYFNRGEMPKALESFAAATKLRPDSVLPLVNASMVYARLGQGEEAAAFLGRALQLDPGNALANYNQGLLLAEKGQMAEAEQHLRTALKTNPDLPGAAYNLGVLLAKDRLDEGLVWVGRAHRLRPGDPKYAYTLAFYQSQKGDFGAAIPVLKTLIAHHPGQVDAYLLLGDIYQRWGKPAEAKAVYLQALKNPELPPGGRIQLEARLNMLSQPEKP